jgi:hypothetical protein
MPKASYVKAEVIVNENVPSFEESRVPTKQELPIVTDRYSEFYELSNIDQDVPPQPVRATRPRKPAPEIPAQPVIPKSSSKDRQTLHSNTKMASPSKSETKRETGTTKHGSVSDKAIDAGLAGQILKRRGVIREDTSEEDLSE